MYRKIKTLLQRRGLRYAPYIVQHNFLPKLAFTLTGSQQSQLRKTASKGINRMLSTMQKAVSPVQLQQIIRNWQGPSTDTAFTRWSLLPVKEETKQAIMNASSIDELVIGKIDQDGRLAGHFGDLPGLETITETGFVPRKKYKLDVVLIEDYVLVRKRFGVHKAQFLQEAATLIKLTGKANVPALFRVDVKNRQLYLNFIPGLTMRDLLAQAGIVIRDTDVQRDTTLQPLSPVQRAAAVRERATQAIKSHFSVDFLEKVETQLKAIHAQGIVNLDIKVGNVIVGKNNTPYFIDFENTQIFKSTDPLSYQLKRDNDRERFNQTFGRGLLTDARARTILEDEQKKQPPWYAPIDFGYGLTVGGFWSTDTGTGRWEYLNQSILRPHLQGKRILDLGSNVGIMPMLMLRDGAQQVIGLELETVNVERARQVHKIFEWRNQRDYDFSIHNRNFHDIVSWDLGQFDIVSSLCSLYYLSEAEMAMVVQKAAQIAPMMIIQANTSTEQEPAKRKKASVEFLYQLLEQAGFDQIDIVAPLNFTRPILIGQQTKSL